MVRFVLGLVLGAAGAAGVVIAARQLDRNHAQEAQLWGDYWASRMAFEYALHSTGVLAHGDAMHWAQINDRSFQALVQAHLIVEVSCHWKDTQEIGEFQRALASVPEYRNGFSLEGGQWPVGLAYIDSLSVPRFPSKFLTSAGR